MNDAFRCSRKHEPGDDMMENEKYEHKGWANYETWRVGLQMKRDNARSGYWRQVARWFLREAAQCSEVRKGIQSLERAANFKLADRLERQIRDDSPLIEDSMYAGLLEAALCKIDYEELARRLLDDLGDDEPQAVDGGKRAESVPAPKPVFPTAGFPHDPPLFLLGRIISTHAAQKRLTHEEIVAKLGRHVRADWGDVSQDDKRTNYKALREGGRLVSVYRDEDGGAPFTISITTEADRSLTTVHFLGATAS